MKFLDTNGSMNIVEREDNDIVKIIIRITDDMLDFNVSQFIDIIKTDLLTAEYNNDKAHLIAFSCDGISDDDILYMRNLVYEIVAEALSGEKLNKDWQPRPTLVDQLDANLRAQTIFLNYEIEPQILNIIFEKDNKICYNMIKERNE